MPILTQVSPKIRSKRLESVPVVSNYPIEPPDIEDVTAEYSPERLEEIDRMVAEAERQIISGEIKPVTDAELQRMLDL